jgi:hypothetical protein
MGGVPMDHGLVLGLVKLDFLSPAPFLSSGFLPPFTLTERV